MEKKIRYRYFTAACLALLVLCGCTREEGIGIPPPHATGKTVNVSLKVSIPPVVDPVSAGDASKTRSESRGGPGFVVRFADACPGMQTRGSDGKTELYNLWLLQFNSDGTINGPARKVSDKVTAVNDMVTLEVPMVVSTNQTLYLLVLGPKLECDPASVTTLENLEKMTLEYAVGQGGQTVSLVTRDEEIPLAGQVSGVTVLQTESGDQGLVEYNKPDGFAGGIEIRRLMSKISLRYKFEVPGYKLDGMKLLNANSVIRLSGNPDINTRDDRYVDITATSPVAPDAEGYRTVSWYVAQNRQGSVSSILAEKDRFNKEVNNVQAGNAPALGTNIEVWAYSTTKKDLYAIYQIYVGKNNTDNFDVDANSFYSLHTMIDMSIDAAQTDGRIRAQTVVSQKVYLCSSWNDTNDQSGQKGPNFDLDAHPDWRPLIVNARGRKVTIGIFADERCTQPANPSNSWLRISSSPNYTEAYNNIGEPLDTRVETIVILPTQLFFYLYSDEYVFGEDGSLAFCEDDPEGNKRSLWVKVTTTPEEVMEGAQSQSIIYRMDQRPAAFTGNFGGEQLSDGYSEGLVYDRIGEYLYSYDGIYKASNIPYGYNGQNTRNAGYRTDDLSSGLEATRYLSENPKNLPFNITNLAGPERDALGRIKLYQYNYYQVYSARYCYDRNRDENGNGVIDPEELKWYLPAVNQLLGHYIDLSPKDNTAFSTFTVNESGNNYASRYDMTNLNVLNAYHSKSTGSSGKPRCVRNVPKQAGSQRVEVVTDGRGNSYAAIKTSGMRRNLNRDDDANFYVNLNLYTENGNNIEQVMDDKGNPVIVRRIRRHSNVDSSNDGYSSGFMVAPVDFPSKSSAWSVANGYLSTANSTAPNVEASAASTGCPTYTGIDGKDPVGSWRLPTFREAGLILMYAKDLENTNDRTSFNKLSGSIRWSATESSGSPSAAATFQLVSPQFVISAHKGNVNTVRCIRDIP